MANEGDIYQIRVTCSHVQVQTAENVFYYRVAENDATLTANQVRLLFHGNIGSGYPQFMPGNSTYESLAVINGMDNTDFDIALYNLPGTMGGNTLPSQLMISTRSPWNGPGTRRGRHYFPFGSTSSIDASGNVSGALDIGMPIFAWSLGQPLSAVATDLIPVTLSGGFKLGVEPVVSQLLTGIWEYSRRWSSMDSRLPDPLWEPGEAPPP
jgi:hypothetical protein